MLHASPPVLLTLMGCIGPVTCMRRRAAQSDQGRSQSSVVQGLRAADAVFGSTENARGYKVISGCGVLQGDGIDIHMLEKISEAVLTAGFSPENVAYGMGGGLLHRVRSSPRWWHGMCMLCSMYYADYRAARVGLQQGCAGVFITLPWPH